MRIISVLLSVLLLAGCGKSDPTEKHQKSRDRIVDVSDRIREIDLGDELLIGAMPRLFVLDDCLLILDPHSYDNLLHVVDKKTFTPLRSGIRRGRGPGELVNPGNLITDEARHRFLIPDYGKQAIYAFSLDEFLHRPDCQPQAAMQMQQDGSMTEERMDSLQKLYRPAYESLLNVQKEYIGQHLDEDVSVYLLSNLGSETALEMLPKLGEKAKSGSMSALYKAMEQALEEVKAREEAKKKVSEGAEAPDFTLKDLQGNDLSLSSLRGKYVVLDFWGSWCGWCIKGIPDMKKYYAKYKDRMEILGIDCRDTEEKWKEAVKKYELPWLHVRNAEESDVTVLYAIEGYPTKIVIDPQGKIAKVVVGEDPAFYEYLDKLFK